MRASARVEQSISIHACGACRRLDASTRDKWQRARISVLERFPIALNRRRHCEERSDEAIQRLAASWIASLRSQ